MRYVALLLLLFVCGCSLPAAVSQGFGDISSQYEKDQAKQKEQAERDRKYTLDSLSNRAIVAFNKGNFDDAQRYAAGALQEDPGDVYALMIMAVVNDTLGMPNKAGFYYQALLETRNTGPTTLGNYRLTQPQPLYEAALSRLKVIDLKQAPFIVKTDEAATPVFEIKSVYVTAEEPAHVYRPAVKTGMELFSPTERNTISRFLTLKALAEKGYITKDEFVVRRTANIGGLLPQTRPMPAKTVTAAVPSTDAIIDRFDSMKNAYELKSMNAREYMAERDIILEALLPVSSVDKMEQVAPPSDLLVGADAVRKLELLYGLELITRAEMDIERAEIENLLKIGRPVPLSTIKPEPEQPKAPTVLVPAPAQTKSSPKATVTRKPPGVTRPK